MLQKVFLERSTSWLKSINVKSRGVAASRFLGRQELVAYKVLVLTLGSMITIPMVWFM